MAKRPVFLAKSTDNSFICEEDVEFHWFPGMAVSQKQKSISSLHESAEAKGFGPILEISSKSQSPIGVKLSAFNLKLKIGGDIRTTVESVYQGSKVFINGGPYTDLYYKYSREAKRDERIFSSGALKGFELDGIKWRLNPATSFYDWLYINSLKQNVELANELMEFKSFTDIEHNPKKQVSCQARSAAYFVSLSKLNLLEYYTNSRDKFLAMYNQSSNLKEQISLKF